MRKSNTRSKAHTHAIDALETRIGAPTSATDIEHALSVYTALVDELKATDKIHKWERIGLDISVAQIVRALKNS